MESLLVALRQARVGGRTLQVQDPEAMVERSDKARFELRDGRIRARYGHSSLPERLVKTVAKPPALLYHGTSAEAAGVILVEELKPMQRQYVHLSTDRETAEKLARRKGPKPVRLELEAVAAHRSGITFYLGNDVWPAGRLHSPGFIRKYATPRPG